MEHPEPSFLANGTFFWDQLGYNYSSVPSIDLLSASAVRSKDPWLIVASALEHAKIGNHSLISRVAPLIAMDSPAILVRACTSLIADAGLDRDLVILEKTIRSGPDYLKIEACWAIREAGLLQLVPAMVTAFESVRSAKDRDSIGAMFEDFLIGEDGEGSAYAEGGIGEFAGDINLRVAALQKLYGQNDVTIWRGRKCGPYSLAVFMHELLKSDVVPKYLVGSKFLSLRHKFECATGIDCTAFFHEEEFRWLSATAIIENVLHGKEVGEYEEGKRYFYGHRIPT